MMPTRARIPESGRPPSPSSFTQDWFDFLSVCKKTGVGLSTNQLYKEDGQRKEEHPFEDISFHKISKVDDNTLLYMVLDGHEGTTVANIAQQRLAADLLLESQNGKSDGEIKEAIKQAFSNVERYYYDTVDDKVAQRTSLLYEIPEGLTSFEIYQRYPQIGQKLDDLSCMLSCGATVVVALVAGNRLFVANVGSCRALLCRTDDNGVLRVVQLSVDHDLSNDDELLRLNMIGLHWDNNHRFRLGNQENTRCLGNYMVKGGYRHYREFVDATDEPILADPEIHPGIVIDDSCRFLLLMSSGLHKTLEEVKGADHVNKEIAQMVEHEFREQATLTGVAQAVVDKIVRMHHDKYMSEVEGRMPVGRVTTRREDMTLLVRNFNQRLPNAQPHTPLHVPASSPDRSTGSLEPTDTTTATTSESTGGSFSPPADRQPATDSPIQPYVDFTEFFANVEIARRNGTLPPELDL